MGPIWDLNHFLIRFPARYILELDIISHSIQIHNTLLWDNDVNIFNNDNHGNIEFSRNITVIPPNMIYTSPIWDPYGTHMGPIWDLSKTGTASTFQGSYEKIFDNFFLQMRSGFIYTYLTKIQDIAENTPLNFEIRESQG